MKTRVFQWSPGEFTPSPSTAFPATWNRTFPELSGGAVHSTCHSRWTFPSLVWVASPKLLICTLVSPVWAARVPAEAFMRKPPWAPVGAGGGFWDTMVTVRR